MTPRLEDDSRRLTPLEIASGLVFGFAPPESLPPPQHARAPLAALENAILPALLRPPCLVSFTGDPYSSAILAVAVRLARREGLELPVPATNRVPGAEQGDERLRRERVIVHLGLTDWIRFEFDAELDVVGPVAMSMLCRHGLTAPFGLHCLLPLIVEASGGSLIVGGIGENSAGMGAPRWLRPAAAEEVRMRRQVELASEPKLWQETFAWLRGLRAVRLGMDSLALLAGPLRVQLLHPFVDPLFSAALRAHPRTAAMRSLFGDLLPTEVLVRRTERSVEAALWNGHSRTLAAGWDGEGVDTALVDPDALRNEWSRERPDRRSFLLLQSVALAREGRSVARQLAEAVGGFA
jgi:asparagine synthase (glutamine-hydrolysing)